MRVLFVTPFAPNARAGHGGGAYLGAIAAAIQAKATCGLCSLAEAPANEAAAPWAWRETVMHHPRGGGFAASLRRLWQWRRLPLVAAKAWNPAFAKALERAVREFRPDVAFVEMAQMAQYLPCLRPTRTILTDHESGCPANTRTGLGPLGDRRDRRLWDRYVRREFASADLIQALTLEDAATLRNLLQREVMVRPPAVALPAGPVAPAQAPPNALFLGDYHHAPNPEAARRLVSDVLPLLQRANPAAELWLAGPNEAPIRDLAATRGVRVLGFVDDLPRLFAEVRLLLAPLWSGSGFRVKAATALAHGLPVVTNELGSRGLGAPAPAIHRGETPTELAAMAATLFADGAAAAAAGTAAFQWARANLAADAIADVQLARAAALLAASGR
jgi:glycosyltransferase involved in cell wall biosynthesis